MFPSLLVRSMLGKLLVLALFVNFFSSVSFPVSSVSAAVGDLPDLEITAAALYEIGVGTVTDILDPTFLDASDYFFYLTLVNNGPGDVESEDASVAANVTVYGDGSTSLGVYNEDDDGQVPTSILTAGGQSPIHPLELTSDETLDIQSHETLTFCVDEDNLVEEADETNNCLSFDNLLYIRLPDMVINSVTLNADNTLHFVIGNIGNADVYPGQDPELHFYDLTNGDGSADEIFLLNDLGTSYQAIGGTMEFDSLYTVPSNSISFLAVIDATGVSQELTEDVFEANYYRDTLIICVDDGTDDTESGATKLVSGEPVEGEICIEDSDFYTFEVEEGDSVVIALDYAYDSTATYENGNSNLDAELSSVFFGGNVHDLVDEDSDEDLSFTVDSSTVFGPGAYTIEVYEYEYSNSYTLSLTVTAATKSEGGSSGSASGSGGGSSGGGGSALYEQNDEDEVQLSEEVTLAEESCEGEMSFLDVDVEDDMYEYIYSLWCRNIVEGRDAYHYYPDADISRAEFLKIALLNAGYSVDGTGSEEFSDVSSDDWFYNYVLMGVDLGIVEGYEDGTFMPNASINRAEALTILSRVAGKAPEDANGLTSSYSDVSDSDWYAWAVLLGTTDGVVEGYPDGTFMPSDPITRAEVAAMAVRSYEAYFTAQ